jgi:DNA-directed RNA polymerase subunit RPC12/RpoP
MDTKKLTHGKPVVNPTDKIKAARRAFQAYERAVEAAQQAMAEGGLIYGLGATVMVGHFDSWGNEPASYACAECGSTCPNVTRYSMNDWKFCPFCGAEILRWDRKKHEETRTIKVKVTESTRELVPRKVLEHILREPKAERCGAKRQPITG